MTNIYPIFAFAKAFNQSMVDWDTGNVVTMESMFQSDVSFNQPNIDIDNHPPGGDPKAQFGAKPT
eukprot:CAMPEP_0204835610 /NCGR_PEP_ID=MMETSP1346-20131115/23080_1 /ASSEMBLY_ACC=CAM_ASM_000771 /TAXON_ID=215587 /ORGANISM="Aplanochytrium stocchinoi, Strain GSBS06" /LENGTH=64 /DNA_ID=CAMNT_0051969779 /DNA_START=310 /DNA_END=504 /DNA_ORIENTATION=+